MKPQAAGAILASVLLVLYVFFSQRVDQFPDYSMSEACTPCSSVCPDRPLCPVLEQPTPDSRPTTATPFLGTELGLNKKYAAPGEVLTHLRDALGIQLDNYAVNVGAGRAEVEKDDAAALWFLKEYRGLAVEGDPSHVEWLRSNLPDRVSLSPQFASPLDIVKVLDTHNAELEMDLLKIDVSSADCPLLDAVLHSKYRPKLITVKVNVEIPPPIRFATMYMPKLARPGSGDPAKTFGVFGCSISHMYVIARAGGYSLVQLLDAEQFGGEAMFVRDDLKFGLPNVPNDPATHYAQLPVRATWPWFAGKRGEAFEGISDEWKTLPTIVAAERIWGNATQIVGTKVPFTLDVPFNAGYKRI